MNRDFLNRRVDGLKDASSHEYLLNERKASYWRMFSPKKKVGGGGWLRLVKIVAWLIVLLGLGLFVYGAIQVNLEKNRVEKSASESANIFYEAVQDFKDFRIKDALRKLSGTGDSIDFASNSINPLGRLLGVNNGDIFSLFGNLGNSYSGIKDFSTASFEILEGLELLEKEWPNALRGKNGEAIISSFEKIRNGVHKIVVSSETIISGAKTFGGVLGLDAVSMVSDKIEVVKIRDFLDAFVPWLSEDKEKRLIVLFSNPSELRPAGGFSGSYLEVVLEKGAVKAIEARDISYADREFGLKVVPPEPLQTIVNNWRAADANWFLDFPLSAEKTLYFLESSLVYKKENIKFEGLASISDKVVEDVLGVVGPIKLSDDREVSKDNFLFLIQDEVQSGHDVGSENSKKILKELTPLIIEKIAGLGGDDTKKIFELFSVWGASKDLLVYMREPAFQRFVLSAGFSGKLETLPVEFSGDYLAITSSNIGGGKSDLAIKQKVLLESQITLDGEVQNHLVIERSHTGKEGDPWWYKMKNKSYLKIYLPKDSDLSYAEGGLEKKIKPPVNYEKLGYEKDPDIEAIESTKTTPLFYPQVNIFEESGKKVFSSWIEVAKGESKNFILDYKRPLPTLPIEGQTYTFIFEKQPGGRAEYNLEFTAPVGFRFKENSLPTFEYEAEDPEGRVELNLTLEKI